MENRRIFAIIVVKTLGHVLVSHKDGYVTYWGISNGNIIGVLTNPQQYGTSGPVIDPATQANNDGRFRIDSAGNSTPYDVEVVTLPSSGGYYWY
jgi:hypothetical protein